MKTCKLQHEISNAYKNGESLTKLSARLGICRKKLAPVAHRLGLDFKHIRPRNDHRVIGKRIGRLTVVSFHSHSPKVSLWNCQCDCGNVKVLPITSLHKSGVKSCGCLKSIPGQNSYGWTGFKDISGTKWNTIVTSAKRRNIDVNLSIEEAYSLFIEQNKKCALTGLDIGFAKTDEHQASLDRIDSSRGYERGNVQWVTQKINIAKQTMSQVDFITLCGLVYKKSLDGSLG